MTIQPARFLLKTCILVFTLLSAFGIQKLAAEKRYVWFASRDQGIYVSTFDTETGTLSEPRQASTENAGFLISNQENSVLYCATSEANTGAIASFKIGDNGTLALQSLATTEHNGPVHMSLNREQNLMAIAHYFGEATAVLAVNKDGSLGALVFSNKHEGSSINPKRQQKAYPHWAGFSSNGRYMHVPDLGTDEIWTYEVDAAQLRFNLKEKVKLPAGSGPRHLAFDSEERFVFLSDEISAKVTALTYDAESGRLTPFQHIKTVDPVQHDVFYNLSEIAVHPSDKYVYTGVRGRDVIVAYQIDSASGRLTLIDREPIRGSTPRHFKLDPSGKWLIAAGARSNTASVFRIDQSSGALAFSGKIVNVPKPISVAITKAN